MAEPRRSRPWHAPVTIALRTVGRTLSALRAYGLGALAPLFVVLALTAGLLWVINTLTPLAPFVYSLF